MTKRELKEAILGALRDLKKNGPLLNLGICGEVGWHLGIGGPVPMLDELMVRWPEHSGTDGFPVPAPDRACAVQAYYYLERWSGPYGDSRRRLLDHLIASISAELETAAEAPNV